MLHIVVVAQQGVRQHPLSYALAACWLQPSRAGSAIDLELDAGLELGGHVISAAILLRPRAAVLCSMYWLSGQDLLVWQ